jgi:hypothetical protein
MQAALRVEAKTGPMVGRSRSLVRYEDPLEVDRPNDAVVSTTRRALCRLALVAAETATRFAREGLPHDPMSWMLAPRALFNGSTAIEACLKRDHCERAIVLHGLSIGFDAMPFAIDRLRSRSDGDHPNDFGLDAAVAGFDGAAGDGDHNSDHAEPASLLACSAPRRLFSATIVMKRPGIEVVVFHASFALDHGEVFERLQERFGGELTGHAEVRRGFDAGHPLIPAEVKNLLLRAIADGAATNETLDVTFERRTVG